jgi:hypothetical protein
MKSVWDDRIRQVEAELAQLKGYLAPLESGKVKLGSRTGNGPWEDITPQAIEQNKRVIQTYEAILADMKKRRGL